MKLFENGVGRPSNEIKKKRRLFVAGIGGACMVAVIGVGLFLTGGIKTSNLKGTSTSNLSNSKTILMKDGVVRLIKSNGGYFAAFFPLGDVTFDGAVTEADAEKILRYSAKLESYNSTKKHLADVNRDGKVNSIDARSVLLDSENGDSSNRYKVCITNKANTVKNCNWDINTAGAYVYFPLQKNTTNYVKLYDEKSKKVTTLLRFKYVGNSPASTGNKIKMTIVRSIKEGQNAIIRVTASDGRISSMVSSNPSVMTVKLYKIEKDNDRYYQIRALNAGTAKITAKSSGGSTISTTYSVKDNTIDPKSIVTSYNTNIYRGIDLKKYTDKTYNNSASSLKYATAMARMPLEILGAPKAVFILSEETFVKKYSSSFGSISYTNPSYIVIRGSKVATSIYYEEKVIYHEFAHAMDSKYSRYTGNRLAPEFDNVYSAYKSSKSTNVTEFYADAIAGYLLKQYYGLDDVALTKLGIIYNAQIEKVAEGAVSKYSDAIRSVDSLATGFLGNPKEPGAVNVDYTNIGNGKTFPLTVSGTPHGGLDITMSCRTAVYAMDGGVVETAEYNDVFGNYIVIDHRNGYKTTYAHLHSFSNEKLAPIKKGAKVIKGELIGYAGTTGNSSGCHLHTELQYTSLLEKYGRSAAKSSEGKGLLNPAKYINSKTTYVGKTK